MSFRLIRVLAVFSFLIASLAVTLSPGLAQSGEGTPDAESLPSFSVTAEAAEDAPVSTERGFFIFELAAGETGEAAVGVINTDTDRELFVELNTVDAITSQGGGAAYTDTGAPISGVGLWIGVTGDTVSVAAAEAGLVFFTVTVPEDTPPGQYLGGISIWHDVAAHSGTPEAEETETEDGTQAGVRIRSRYVLPVQINVPGEWTVGLEVTNSSTLVRPSGAWVIIDLNNTGTTFLRPTGTFVLTDQATGEGVITEQVMMDTFATGTTCQLWFRLPEGAVPGTYDIVLDLAFGDDQTLHYEATVEAVDEGQ